MTSAAAIAIALALVIYEISLFRDNSNIIKEEHSQSKLVYLLTVCLLLKRFSLFPGFMRATVFPICFLLEIPLSIIILEISLMYVWEPLKEYLVLYSDDILVHLYEETQFEWFICPLCCGKNDCSNIFASLVLKIMSFVFLLTICLVAIK